ncbi:MAG: HesA/MoeB/ThiF family protein [Bacteroidetes bacterium]|nr:HesA/MoeB/ThiF family protein [Bacteroidota bacterium]
MSKFSKDEFLRYSRQMMLCEIGSKGQEKIRAAKVIVIGAGGLGCPVLQYLAGAGIGTLGIVDFDRVELHNLHRQVLYTTQDIGKSKAQLAAERIKMQNPAIETIVFNEMLTETNAEKILAPFDIVIDGSDNFPTRYLVNDMAVKLNKIIVYGTIYNFEGQLAVFNYNGSKNLRHLYPEAPNPEDVPSCNENGVLGMVPGILGLYMALTTLQLVTGLFDKSNRLFLFDFSGFGIRQLSY